MRAGTRGRWNGGPRACAILAALGLTAQPVMAQEPVTVPGGLRVRKVVLTKTPTATIYGAPGKPLLVMFDTPLGKGPVKAPGVEVHRHPLKPNTLVVTPSRALGISRGSAPVAVALPDGVVTLSLVLKPDAPDARVDITRPPDSSRGGQPEQSVTSFAAPTLRVIVSNATWPDSSVKCRMSLLVQTPNVPAGIPMEIRSADPTLCESTGLPSMRADGGR
ncbi:MAG TPA: DUF2381 family protein [Myxococcaceae bacterium]